MAEQTPKKKLPMRVKAKGASRLKNLGARSPVKSEGDGAAQGSLRGKKRARIVFDEEGLDVEQEVQADGEKDDDEGEEEVIAKQAVVEDAEDESDDDAPEAVSTTQMASQIKASAQKAQKAAKEHAAAQKKKRRERDAVMKQQAKARKAVEGEAKQAEADGTEESSGKDPEEDTDILLEALQKRATAISDELETTKAMTKKGRHSRPQSTTPALLPAEFLTDSDSELDDNDDVGVKAAAPPASKRRKVETVEKELARERKAPADKRVGATVYRVMKALGDGKLAPVSSKNSAYTRSTMQKRNRSAVAVNRGFFGSRK